LDWIDLVWHIWSLGLLIMNAIMQPLLILKPFYYSLILCQKGHFCSYETGVSVRKIGIFEAALQNLYFQMVTVNSSNYFCLLFSMVTWSRNASTAESLPLCNGILWAVFCGWNLWLTGNLCRPSYSTQPGFIRMRHTHWMTLSLALT